jgi:hypothetical protein
MWYRVVKASFGGAAVQQNDENVFVLAPETLQVLNPSKVSIVNNSSDNIEEVSLEPSESLEGQLAEIRDEDDVDVNMSTKERGNGSQYFFNGAGYTRANSGKGAPMFWQNVPSNQTWV